MNYAHPSVSYQSVDFRGFSISNLILESPRIPYYIGRSLESLPFQLR